MSDADVLDAIERHQISAISNSFGGWVLLWVGKKRDVCRSYPNTTLRSALQNFLPLLPTPARAAQA